MFLFLQSTRVDWSVTETSRHRKESAQIPQLAMWIGTISFAVGVHRLTSPLTRTLSRTDTSKGKQLIESCCTIFPAGGIPEERIACGEMFASRVPLCGTKDAGRGLWLRLKNTCKQFHFSVNQILPTLFTLRDDESKNNCRDVFQRGRRAVWLSPVWS